MERCSRRIAVNCTVLDEKGERRIIYKKNCLCVTSLCAIDLIHSLLCVCVCVWYMIHRIYEMFICIHGVLFVLPRLRLRYIIISSVALGIAVLFQ